MKTRIATFVVSASIFFLTGCVQSYWVKPGGSESDFRVDQTECQILAVQTVPVDRQNITISNGYTTPAYTTCSGSGNMAGCTTTGGQYVPPVNYNYDANEDLRGRAEILCLEKRGWRLMTEEEIRKENQRTQSITNSTTSPASDGTLTSVVVEGGYCYVSENCMYDLICRRNRCVSTSPSKTSRAAQDADKRRYISYEGQACGGATTCGEGLTCVNRVCIRQ